METKAEEQLLKIRSARACVLAGFRLFMQNFRCILRTTWVPALFTALVTALSSKLYPMALLSLVMTVVTMSYIFSIMNHYRTEQNILRPGRWWTLPDKRQLGRTALSALIWVMTTAITGGIGGAIMVYGNRQQSLSMMIGGAVVMLILILLLLPLCYPQMRYVTTTDTKLTALFGKGFAQGLRQWGLIFAVLIVVALIAMVVLGITMLPAIILGIAEMKSQAGVAIGDPAGMPDYMQWLSLVVFTLSSFIQIYVMMALHFPLFFMAGSIEQQEILKNEKAKDTLY